MIRVNNPFASSIFDFTLHRCIIVPRHDDVLEQFVITNYIRGYASPKHYL